MRICRISGSRSPGSRSPSTRTMLWNVGYTYRCLTLEHSLGLDPSAIADLTPIRERPAELLDRKFRAGPTSVASDRSNVLGFQLREFPI